MTPEQPEQLACELCGTPGLLAELTFRRGKPRRVCVVCMADAIEKVTGWRMGRQVRGYIESAALAPLYRAKARELQIEVERQREALLG